MKLDKREVVARRIALLEKEGIKFLCNATVGENVEPQLLVIRISTPPSSAPAPRCRAT